MTETDQRTRTGLLYALATFGAWGLNPFYFKAVDQIPPIEVLAHRVIWSSLLLAALIRWGRQWGHVAAAFGARRTLGTLALTSLIIGGNWLLYIHAMDTSQVLQASLEIGRASGRERGWLWEVGGLCE